MIELERTYLAKFIPQGLENCESKEIIDIYIPKAKRHPTLRIRKSGDKYEITKKEPVEDDASVQNEHTTPLTKEEFEVLSKLDGRKTYKIRYYMDYNGYRCEVDVFQGALKGLIVIDFEFDSEEDKNNFKMPDFCLIDVTKEEFIAGGMICGKTYEDIKDKLDVFGYKSLILRGE
jgi:CYTH domain-containing protein